MKIQHGGVNFTAGKRICGNATLMRLQERNPNGELLMASNKKKSDHYSRPYPMHSALDYPRKIILSRKLIICKGVEIMANEQNLKHFTSEQSREEAVKNGRKGGIKSGESKRKRKLLKEHLELLLETKIQTSDGEITKSEAITLKLIEQALKGNVKAYKLIRDTLGEAPIQKIQTSEVDPETVKELEAMIEEEFSTMADKKAE